MAARQRALPVCMTIGELESRPELALVRDPRSARRLVGRAARSFDSFLVDPSSGEAWGFMGKLLLPNKLACRVR